MAEPYNTYRRSLLLLFWALLLCVDAAELPAQTRTPQEPRCFSIHVRLNGKPIEAPQIVTLRTTQNDNTAPLEGGCFRVPPALLTEKAVDVFFAVPRNRVYLSAIPTGFLAGPWDVDLEDKKFGREVVLPKHAHTREACAVVFHVGEPETALLQTGCRTPLPATAPKAR
jgi:hypothetical protein